jgi:hypothetical protein
MNMVLLIFLLVVLVAASIIFGLRIKESDYVETTALVVLIVLLAFAVIAESYDLNHPKANPIQSGSVNWGVIDSTLIINSNRFEIVVGLHPDGTLTYRKGKAK